MLTIGQVCDQLVDIYLYEEDWHINKLSRETATKYFAKLVEQGSILYEEEDGKVVGYIEIWKINAKQLNRIKKHQPFCADGEDIINGTIGFLANVWIDREHRNKATAKKFKKFWDDKTQNCNLFAGMRKNKQLRIHRNTEV